MPSAWASSASAAKCQRRCDFGAPARHPHPSGNQCQKGRRRHAFCYRRRQGAVREFRQEAQAGERLRSVSVATIQIETDAIEKVVSVFLCFAFRAATIRERLLLIGRVKRRDQPSPASRILRYLPNNFALKYSRFKKEMCSTAISLGQTASHSYSLVQLPKPSTCIASTIATVRLCRSGWP